MEPNARVIYASLRDVAVSRYVPFREGVLLEDIVAVRRCGSRGAQTLLGGAIAIASREIQGEVFVRSKRGWVELGLSLQRAVSGRTKMRSDALRLRDNNGGRKLHRSCAAEQFGGEACCPYLGGLQLLLGKGKRRQGAYSLRRLNNNAEKNVPRQRARRSLSGAVVRAVSNRQVFWRGIRYWGDGCVAIDAI
jgi:hypothetical protein